MRKQVVDKTDEVISLVNTVWHRGSYAFRNHLYLIEKYREFGNLVLLSEHRALLGRLETLGVRNLSTPPKMEIEQSSGDSIGDFVGRAHGTGHRLRYVRKAYFNFPNRKKGQTTKDYHEMSRDMEAYWLAVFEKLTLPPKRFKRSFKFTHSEKEEAEKQKDVALEELVLSAIEKLQQKLQQTIKGLIEKEEIDKLVEILRYAPELKSGNIEGVRFKRDAHNLTRRLQSFILEEGLNVPRALASTCRILDPTMTADMSDWLKVLACTSQVLKDPVKGVLGPLLDDLKFAVNPNNELNLKLDLDTKLSPIHWYHEIPRKTLKDFTLREIIETDENKLYLTNAEAERIKRLPNFIQRRREYIAKMFTRYFNNTLTDMVEKMWPIFEADKEELAEAKKGNRKPNTALTKELYKQWKKFFETTNYSWYEGSKRKRPDSLEENITRSCSINECRVLVPDLFVSYQQIELAKRFEEYPQLKALILRKTFVPVQDITFKGIQRDERGKEKEVVIDPLEAANRISKAQIKKSNTSFFTIDFRSFTKFQQNYSSWLKQSLELGIMDIDLLKRRKYDVENSQRVPTLFELAYNTYIRYSIN